MTTRLDGDRVLVTGAALADGRSPSLQRGVSVYVEGGLIAGIWHDGAEPERSRTADARLVDGSGATLVPGLVDCHAHLSLPGGAQWIARGFDPTDTLLEVSEENAVLMLQAGIRWARDVGAPRRRGADGRERALSLVFRDRWAGAPDRPYVRAAGTWLTRLGSLPEGLAVEIEHGADLVAAVVQQLDEGADLVKLYLDGPDPDSAPFSVAEVRAAVDAAHARGARVAAHSGNLPGAQVGAAAAVDSLEHGFVLDEDTGATMAANGVTLTSTLAVLRSWETFAATSLIDRFAGTEGRQRIAERRETAEASVRLAAAAGVSIAAGSDFGGGSLRANQLAWEVEALITAGLEPVDALAAATWRGGDLYGDPAAGRITVGGPAHFSLVHGDPLSDPQALWRVWLTR